MGGMNACERPVRPNIISLSIWVLVSDSNQLRARVARSMQAIVVAILLIPGWRTPLADDAQGKPKTNMGGDRKGVGTREGA